MKLFSILVAFFICANTYAQFKFEGVVNNYPNQPVMVKIYQDGSLRFLNKITTDSKGKLTYQLPFEYEGKVILVFPKGQIEMFTENQTAKFEFDYGKATPKVIYLNKGINQAFQAYVEKQSMETVNQQYLQSLSQFYTPNDAFYQHLNNEINRINNLPNPDLTAYPDLQYYISSNDQIQSLQSGKVNPEQMKASMLNHLLNDGIELENYGLLQGFLMNYISTSIPPNATQENLGQSIIQSVDELLNQVQRDTPRGQAILASVIKLADSNGMQDIAGHFLNQVNELTCELTADLADVQRVKTQIVVGKKAPNFTFEKPVNGKKSLYDIKADKKVVMFFASWCGACNNELPFVKEFYTNFKSAGGEIVGVALEVDPRAFQDKVKDLDWYNYSDFLKWDSPIAQLYGVTGTPTFFLLDKDNTILKISNSIAEFADEY